MDHSNQSPETKALHCRIDNTTTHPATTPIYQSSAFSADSPYFYTRKSNPNSTELELALAELEQADYVISCTTGMTAIDLVLSQLKVNAHLVVNKDIYGCSYKLFQRYQAKMHLTLTVLDLSTAEGRAQLPNRVDMVFFETPTNPFLKTIPIQAVADSVKTINPDALVVVDNTWASSVFQNPLQCGADISLMSATKFISGHSDVMGGVIATNNEGLKDELLATRFYSGAILDPNSAWLLRRSLQTLPIRLREHVRTTNALVEFLTRHECVKQVYFPTLDPHQLRDYGGIIFIELAEPASGRYREFIQHLNLFDTGTGMACVSSMVAQPWSGSHASLDDDEKRAMGITPDLVRLCFGLESAQDLMNDISRGFDQLRMKSTARETHES